jgi:hypothetical protein
VLHAIRKTLFALACCMFGALVAAFTDPPKASPRGLWRGLDDLASGIHPAVGAFLGAAGEGLFTAGFWAAAHPVPVAAVFAIVAVPALIASLIRMLPRAIAKDPVRLYTSDQRRVGGDRAEGRCEMEGVFFTRCRRPGEHGDHWFPHSKGGSTSMTNFVWACARCNTSKGARVPTFWETTRLEWRRRRYFPTHEHARPYGKVRA